MIKINKVKRRGQILTWVGVVEGYRPSSGAPPKQRTIKSFGYLEDQTDPVAFMAEVEEFNATYKDKDVPLRIEAEGTARMYSQENRKQNYGYKYLEAVYDMLGIDKFINTHLRESKFRGEYCPSEIFKFVTIQSLSKNLFRAHKHIPHRTKNTFPEFDSSPDHGSGICEILSALHCTEAA